MKVYVKHGWPSGLRRQFKVLFSSGAWVRTPLHAFFETQEGVMIIFFNFI